MNNLDEKIPRDYTRTYPKRKLQNVSLKQDQGETTTRREHARVSVQRKQTYYYGSNYRCSVSQV